MTLRKVSSTKCVHGGDAPCENANSITTPIVHSAPFTFKSTKDLVEFVEGRSRRKQPEYGRMGNPTVVCAEKRLAALEGAERALLFASGMAAITTLFLSTLESGNHLIVTNDSYQRTRDFAAVFLRKFGVGTSVVKPSLEAIKQAIRPNTKMIFTESPTNPYLFVVDVEGLARIGKENGLMTVVDSTFATPVNLRPLEFGIDHVIHSATKYLGGHNDLIAGVLAGSTLLVEQVLDLHKTIGAICDPNTAFLLDRGLKTLAIRVEKQNESGQVVAEFLEAHPKVSKVLYPGLKSHPQYDIAGRQMSGFGGVVTFLLDTDFEGTARFIDCLEIPRIAPSLGGVETLVEQAVVMGYWGVPKKERESLGMNDNLVRLSLGIEEVEDIIADLDQGLRRI